MTILTIRTDKPEAEIGIYNDAEQQEYIGWEAHRELAETIHKKIDEILNKSSISLDDIQGIVAFEGPGSFTGLRIGLATANALAYGLNISIVATGSEGWQEQGINALLAGQNDKIALPNYGAPAHTTTPKK